MAEIEKRIGEASMKKDEEENYYSWIRYDSGSIFCGINCSELEFYFTIDKNSLIQVYFEAVYEKTNADAVDNLIDDLTKKLGTPSIEKKKGTTGLNYIEYEWNDGSYVIHRDDDEILGKIIFGVNTQQKAKELCGMCIDQVISTQIWPIIEENAPIISLYQSKDELCKSKKVSFSRIDIHGEVVHCEGQVELTAKSVYSSEIAIIFSFDCDGNLQNETNWTIKISDAEVEEK